MNEVERRLRRLPLPAVPSSLDARVAALLTAARRRGARPAVRLVPLWGAIAACLTAALLASLLTALAVAGGRSDRRERVYVLDPTPALLSILDRTRSDRRSAMDGLPWTLLAPSTGDSPRPAPTPRLAAPRPTPPELRDQPPTLEAPDV